MHKDNDRLDQIMELEQELAALKNHQLGLKDYLAGRTKVRELMTSCSQETSECLQEQGLAS